jgi:hypothetical protein
MQISVQDLQKPIKIILEMCLVSDEHSYISKLYICNNMTLPGLNQSNIQMAKYIHNAM